MAKKGLHPEWHSDAKVICNGEEVLTTSGTQGSYTGALNGCWLLPIAAVPAAAAAGDAHAGAACWRRLDCHKPVALALGWPAHATAHNQPACGPSPPALLTPGVVACCSGYLERQPPLLPGQHLHGGD